MAPVYTHTVPLAAHEVVVLVKVWTVVVSEMVVMSVKIPRFLAVVGETVTIAVDQYVAVLVGTMICLVMVAQAAS